MKFKTAIDWPTLGPKLIIDYQNGLGCYLLGQKYGISRTSITNYFKEIKFPIRTKKENAILQSEMKKQPQTNKVNFKFSKETPSSYNKSFRSNRLLLIYETFLKNKVCTDCGYSNLLALDFDHRDPTDKQFNITTCARKGYSWDKIVTEVAKCDIVCKNCHAIRTAKYFGNWRLAVMSKI